MSDQKVKKSLDFTGNLIGVANRKWVMDLISAASHHVSNNRGPSHVPPPTRKKNTIVTSKEVSVTDRWERVSIGKRFQIFLLGIYQREKKVSMKSGRKYLSRSSTE